MSPARSFFAGLQQRWLLHSSWASSIPTHNLNGIEHRRGKERLHSWLVPASTFATSKVCSAADTVRRCIQALSSSLGTLTEPQLISTKSVQVKPWNFLQLILDYNLPYAVLVSLDVTYPREFHLEGPLWAGTVSLTPISSVAIMGPSWVSKATRNMLSKTITIRSQISSTPPRRKQRL